MIHDDDDEQIEDLDDYDMRAVLVQPDDGSIAISSEKVLQNRLASIDGYDSQSGGFDFAIAFEGDGDEVGVELTVR